MAHDRAQRPDTTGSASTTGVVGGNGPTSDPRTGTYFLGRYRVVDEIGLGGMASVHLARMDGLGGFQKWIAIKKIHAHLIEDESFIQMFLDEARIAARISHPNVATVFELGQHENTYWIAMEYLHGEPLREVMRRTEELGMPMPPEIACRVIADAAEGLHAAHELLGKNGEQLMVVHRDVTPHNLFVTYDGTTKVVDFGIAKFASRMASTRAGTLKGKLAYMSPEQVHGEALDRRTDVFALGVVLWELTTGQRLFRMESDLDTLAKVQECNVPRPSTLVRGYPIDLEKIVMKALAKNRGERFKTAREFSRALQSLLMRRGLFIASDEVASYVQSIFTERIQKREAHLRWAAEVTQTLNVDALKASAPTDSLLSVDSELKLPSASQKAPRPAAGMPAIMPPSGQLPRPMPAPTAPPRQSAPPPAPSPETVRPMARRAAANPKLLTTGESMEFDVRGQYEDGPTIQGSMPDFSDDDDDEDQDETLVTSTHGEGTGNLRLPAPMPAAGRPASFNQTQETLAAPLEAPQLIRPLGYGQSRVPVPVESGPTQPLPTTNPGLGPRATPFPPRPQGQDVPFFPPMGPSGHASSAGIIPTPGPARPAPFIPIDRDNRTVTARALKRGIPMWAVALASGLVALLFVGLIYLLIAGPEGGSKKAAAPQPSSSATTAATTATAAGSSPTTTPAAQSANAGGGPFGAARAAFTTTLGQPRNDGKVARPP